jgi:hypothetical protein
MDDRFRDERYAAAELIWTAEPNRFLVAEVTDSAPGRALDLDGLVIDKAERVRRAVQAGQGTVGAIDALVRAHDPRPHRPT